MKQAGRNPKHPSRLAARLGIAASALLCLGLLAASPALGAYEQVGNFAGTPGALKLQSGTSDEVQARWPEEVQFGGLGGMAVNYTGAGGVPAGTVYGVRNSTTGDNRTLISRYNADGSFSERWSFEGSPEPDERCGPEGDPATPTCTSQPEGAMGSTDVDVDQTTGYVYVYSINTCTYTTEKCIHVYTPDGSEVKAAFGEYSTEEIAASPGKIHFGGFSVNGAIAVNGSGDVYAFDADSSYHHRLMVFEPQSPGDYEHYVYAGQGHDIDAGTGGILPQHPAVDAEGNLYVAEMGGVGRFAKFDPSQPAAPPLCEFSYPKNGIISLAVNPLGGEVFFQSEKNKEAIHELGAGCEENGKFTEVSTFAYSPSRSEISGLAFDPLRSYSAGRPAGILYAGAPGEEGGKEEGSYPETLVESALGYIFARPPEVHPVVEAQSILHVSATTATLSAQINPEGAATRYAFQYIPESTYEENEPTERFAGALESPLGGAVVGEGTKAVAVSAALEGLAPDTAYRVRAVATSHCSTAEPEKLCEGAGAALALRTFSVQAPGLPDRRAYELVSPAQKEGGQVWPVEGNIFTFCPGGECKPGARENHFPLQSTPNGDAVSYEGSAFSSEEGTLSADEYLARRDPQNGWQSVLPTPTLLASRQKGFGYKAFAAELSIGVLRQTGPTLASGAPTAYQDLYAQSTTSPFGFTPLLRTGQSFHRSASEFEIEYAGASADLSRIFFTANDALTEETETAPAAVDGGKTKNNLYEWHNGQVSLVNVMPGNSETQPGASLGEAAAYPVSDDGSRVFFSDESGQVYVRINGQETKEIETEGSPDPGKFVVASTDGSAVLLANGHLHYLGDEEPTIDLTEGKGGFQGVVGESEDLSHIYFVDTEALAANEGAGLDSGGNPQVAEEGKDNLYAWTQGGGTRFVAQLVSGDNAGTFNQLGASDWKGVGGNRSAEASPHGRYLAFMSEAPLTGHESVGICKIVSSGPPAVWGQGPCQEAFLYDSATGRLTCPSCNRSGENALGASVLRRSADGTRPRYLTDEGRLFFDSRDSLVPADTNEGVEDVYEWEPRGVGSCTSESAEGGCVSLISAGTGLVDSNFAAADPSGRDVFFTTRDQLTLKDRDQLIDLYDARVEGGIPAETETARGECEGEACQAPVSVPDHPTPATSAPAGEGNVAASHAHKHKKKHKKAKKRHAKHKHKHRKGRHGKRHANRAAKRHQGGRK